MSETNQAADEPMSEAYLLAVINRQQGSIFHADMLIRMLLRKLGDRAVLKPHELEVASNFYVVTSNDDDGNFIMQLVAETPGGVQ